MTDQTGGVAGHAKFSPSSAHRWLKCTASPTAEAGKPDSPNKASATGTIYHAVAERAMIDVRRIAAEPHPVGTIEHALVQAYLLGRMTDMGLAPTLQAGLLSPAAVARIEDRMPSIAV